MQNCNLNVFQTTSNHCGIGSTALRTKNKRKIWQNRDSRSVSIFWSNFFKSPLLHFFKIVGDYIKLLGPDIHKTVKVTFLKSSKL